MFNFAPLQAGSRVSPTHAPCCTLPAVNGAFADREGLGFVGSHHASLITTVSTAVKLCQLLLYKSGTVDIALQ